MSDDSRPTDDAVVVPAIAAGSSITSIRSLAKQGVYTIGVSENESAAAFRSQYCHETASVTEPTTDVRGYRDDLLELARRPAVRTIVPLREPDIYVLSRWRDEFAEHVAAPWQPYDEIRRTQDRFRLFEAARDVGVAVPETSPVDEWDGWDDVTVVKSRYSILEADNETSYPGVSFVMPDEDPRVDEHVEEAGHVPMAQEYVPGDDEHGFFALYDHGDPVATFQHQRIRSYDYAGGASTYRKSVHIPELKAAGRRLLSHLDWHGPAMVEFKRDESDGEFKLMEINPRFWGSLALPVAAGVDFPALYYRLATGDIDEPVFEYETGVGCHLVRGEISYLYNLFNADHDHVERPPLAPELYRIARSFVTDANFDYLDFGDARPFVHDILSATLALSDG